MSWIPAANWVEAWIRSMGRASLDGSLAVVGAWLICRFLPRMSATARSWIWRCVYLKLVLLLLWPGPIPVPLFRDPGVSLGRPQSPLRAGAVPLELLAARQDFAAETPRFTPPRPKQFGVRFSGVALFGVWLGGVLIIAIRTGQNVFTTCRKLRESQPLTQARVRQECEALSQSLGLKQCPRLLTRPDVFGPQAVGLLRPALVFPASFADRFLPEEIRLVLAHELAHVRRLDLLWDCLRQVVNGLLFFHPLVRVARRQASLADEIACDEAALHEVNATISDYAGALLKVTEQSRMESWDAPVLLGTGMGQAYRVMALRFDALKQFRDGYFGMTRGRRRRATFLACLAALVLLPLGLMNCFHNHGIRQLDPRYPVLGFKLSRGQSHTLTVRRETCRFAGFTLSRVFEDDIPASGTPPGGWGARSSTGWTNDNHVSGTTIPGRVAGLLRKLGLKPRLDTTSYNSGVLLADDSCVLFVRFAYDPKCEGYEDIGALLVDGHGESVVLTPYRSESPLNSEEYVKCWVVSPAPTTRETFTLHLRLGRENKDIAVVRLDEF